MFVTVWTVYDMSRYYDPNMIVKQYCPVESDVTFAETCAVVWRKHNHERQARTFDIELITAELSFARRRTSRREGLA